jgi:hypothetical protein
MMPFSLKTLMASLLFVILAPAGFAQHYRSGSHSHSYSRPNHSSHSYSGHSHAKSYSYHHPKAPRAPKVPKTYSSTARDSNGRIKRSRTARSDFMRQHPCPSTGKSSGACPGYVVDHRNPLACGGADSPSNMQWQTTADGKAKDKVERKGCR